MNPVLCGSHNSFGSLREKWRDWSTTFYEVSPVLGLFFYIFFTSVPSVETDPRESGRWVPQRLPFFTIFKRPDLISWYIYILPPLYRIIFEYTLFYVHNSSWTPYIVFLWLFNPLVNLSTSDTSVHCPWHRVQCSGLLRTLYPQTPPRPPRCLVRKVRTY